MIRRQEGSLITDVEFYLRRLAAVAESASNASGTAAIASALVETQRVTAWGLRSAVELGRARGLSWRQLADLLDIPASTLHRQYRSGAAILTSPEHPPDLLEAPAAPTRVPPGFDRFVGRERELAHLPDLLGRTRLLSVIGPVGVGKARLAAECHRAGATHSDYKPGGLARAGRDRHGARAAAGRRGTAVRRAGRSVAGVAFATRSSGATTCWTPPNNRCSPGFAYCPVGSTSKVPPP